MFFTKIFQVVKRYECGIFRLTLDLIYTKIVYKKSRLIRRPIYIRGKRFINIGNNLTTGVGVRIDAFPEETTSVIHFGNNIQLNDYVHIAAVKHISIGDDSLIASHVFITDHNHGSFDNQDKKSFPYTCPIERPLSCKPVHIGKCVWIGEQVCVLPGVTIGDGAVIGAGAVVSKSIPSCCVAVGNPARVIRCFDHLSGEWEKK